MNATILVIEDDLEVQELIALNLERAGYRALRASSVSVRTSISTIPTCAVPMVVISISTGSASVRD